MPTLVISYKFNGFILRFLKPEFVMILPLGDTFDIALSVDLTSCAVCVDHAELIDCTVSSLSASSRSVMLVLSDSSMNI